MTTPSQQAKDRYGGVKVGAAFFGFLTAVGMTAVLAAAISAAGYGLQVATGTGRGDALDRAREETGASADEIGLAGVAVVLLVVFVAYLCGGYVAGRMARFHGVRQGVAVWAWAVLVVAGLTVLALTTGERPDGPDQLAPLTPSPGERAVGLVALAVVALLTLLASVLGGMLGMRFHRRVDRAEAVAP